MDKYDRFTLVQLVEDRIEQRVSQVSIVCTGKKAHAVEGQDVQRVGDFFQCTVHVRKREKSKRSESRRMFQNHSRLEFVARAGHLTQSMNVFQRHPRSQRGYDGGESPTVHV